MAVSIVIDITQNSQSIANNTSSVTVKVNAKWTYGSYNKLEKSGSCTIDGTKYTFTSPFNTGQTTSGSCNLYTKTLTIKHESDGEKTLSVSASYTSGVSSGTVSASASKTLTTIPRKSSLTVANGTLDTKQTLKITELASSMAHKLAYKCGSASGYILGSSSATSTALSVDWTPPLSLASQNTTGTSVSITFTLTTYNGSTSIGSNTYTKTFSIPSKVKPSCSLAVSDPTGNATKYDAYIKGMSKIKGVITATKSYDSAIASYSASANGSNYTASSFTTDLLKSSGSLSITAKVTDKRGRTSDTAKQPITVLDYAKPKISSLSAKRTDANGVADSSGSHLTINFKASVTALNDNNSASYVVKYKKNTETNYTDEPLTNYANTYSITNGVYTFPADTSSSYDIILSVADDFTASDPIERSCVGASIQKTFSVFASKTKLGWAFGKVVELVGYLDIAFKTLFRDHAYFQNAKCIYGTKLDGTRMEVIAPINTGNNFVLGYGLYDNKDGNTNIYGHDINFGVSTTASPDFYRPYRRKGDTISLTYRGSGYVTNSGKDVSFWIPFACPIIGSPNVTASSNNGFVLRQDNKYTHGSDADVYVSPASYEATKTTYNGVYIKAVFSNTTNVTNNAPIGILWSGTITLS